MAISPIIKSHTFEPIGRCIYCGAIEYIHGNSVRKLAKEHIIPFGIAGNSLVLPEASCQRCERITQTFEQKTLRVTLGALRKQVRAPSRKGHGPGLQVHLLDDNRFSMFPRKRSISIAPNEYPQTLVMPHLFPPNILNGLPGTSEKQGVIRVMFAQEELEKFSKIYGSFGMARLEWTPFVRMLAKIAHSYAIAIHGYGFFTPVLTDFILGKTALYNEFVGGDYDIPPKSSHSYDYEISTVQKTLLNVTLIAVNLRLFASWDSPQYFIVVGTINNGQK